MVLTRVLAVETVQRLKDSKLNLEPTGYVDKMDSLDWKETENRYSGDFRKYTVGAKQ